MTVELIEAHYKTFRDANTILQNKQLVQLGCIAILPLTSDSALLGLADSLHAKDIVGFERRLHSNGAPTDIVEFSFVRRCYYCQRDRHTSNQCRSSHSPCSKCAGEHETKNWTLEAARCANCRGAYRANSDSCAKITG